MIPIWTGHLGTNQTLNLMRKLVLDSLTIPIVCNTAATIFMKMANPLTQTDKFLRDRFVYTDETIETLQAPDYMLNGLKMSGVLRGDCDDITTLHASLLTCMGIKVRFVAIRSTFEDPNFDHVFLEAQSPEGDWIPFDVTLPLGYEMKYFGRLTVQV